MNILAQEKGSGQGEADSSGPKEELKINIDVP